MLTKILNQIQRNKKYVFYALSIVVSRGLEYFVLFYAALYLSKENYGELEFYKKIIELFAVALAFGLPSLLLTYTKSKNSKIYLNVISLFFIIVLSLVLFLVFLIFNYQFILIPILFHAVFFNNGILPVLFITNHGSDRASIYKIIISLIFYLGIFLLLLFHDVPQRAFVTVNYYLIFIGGAFLTWLYKTYNLKFRLLNKYFGLFKKLLFSSLSLVVSNFANIMFLYTDILILKLISKSPNLDIGNYSFALNIANLLIIIPLTIVQVDIERIKTLKKTKQTASKILKFVIIGAVLAFFGYLFLVHTYYTSFKETLYLFIIILSAKYFQTQSVLYGTILLIKKKFKANLIVNLTILVLNVILSYLLFLVFGVIGVAMSSVLTLALRFLILKYYFN